MNLKRDDLVKQFDLIVKQEIKNHNEQIRVSNLSINKIREDVEGANSKQAQVNAALASEISRMTVNSLELSNVLGNLINKLSSLTNDLNSSIENVSSQISLLNKKYHECKAALQEFDKEKKLQEIRMNFLEEKINEIPKNLNAFRERIENKAMQFSCKIKEEILSLPSEAKILKEELTQKMEIDRVDFQGVLKELVNVKKAHFINDKKIENIYTLIDRLTKKIEAK